MPQADNACRRAAKTALLTVAVLLTGSCKEREPEFIRSSVYRNLYLVKDFPDDPPLARKLIGDFVSQNGLEDGAEFYRYSPDTAYFLENKEDPGGFSSEEIYGYQDADGIASFDYITCEDGYVGKKGIVRYYDTRYGYYYNPVLLVNKCERIP